MADRERHDEFGEEREPQRDLAVFFPRYAARPRLAKPMIIMAQVESSGTGVVDVTKNQPKVAGGSWKPLPVPVVNADSLSNSVPRTEEKWNIYDVFGSPNVSGLLMIPPR